MKVTRAKIYLFTDIAIGIAMLVEMVSGFVLWAVLPHGGYQGGTNPFYGATFMLTRDGWLALHDWFALVITLGIGVHLLLHRRWIAGIFRSLWHEAFPETEPVGQGQECPA